MAISFFTLFLMAGRSNRSRRRRRKTEKETRKVDVTRHDKHGRCTRLRHRETDRVRRRSDGGARIDCHRHVRFDCPPPQLPNRHSTAVHFRGVHMVRPPPYNPEFVKRSMPVTYPRVMNYHHYAPPPYHFIPSAPNQFAPYSHNHPRNHSFVGPWY